MKAISIGIKTGIVLALLFFAAVFCRAELMPPEPPLPDRLLVVYYSLSGTTRTIAEALAESLGLEAEALVSKKKRQGIFKITCVFDQLFDRDDDLQPTGKDLSAFEHLIIASPVWIHRLSSPMRTFLKTSPLQGKTAWLVLTNNGNFDDEDQRNIIQHVESFGIRVLGCTAVNTSSKNPDELRRAARAAAGEIKFSVQQKR